LDAPQKRGAWRLKTAAAQSIIGTKQPPVEGPNALSQFSDFDPCRRRRNVHCIHCGGANAAAFAA